MADLNPAKRTAGLSIESFLAGFFGGGNLRLSSRYISREKPWLPVDVPLIQSNYWLISSAKEITTTQWLTRDGRLGPWKVGARVNGMGLRENQPETMFLFMCF